MSDQPSVRTPDDLDAAFMTRALQSAGLDVTVGGIECRELGEGAGMMSVITRVALRYERGRGPDSVVIKLPTPSAQNRQVATDFDNYRREVRFYTDAAHLTRMRTPRLYFAECAGPADFVLVLEDLSEWTVGDQVRGCNAEQAQQCVRALAQLHGAFWNRVDDGRLDWMPDSADSVMSEGLSAGTAAFYDAFVDLFADTLTEPLRTLGPRYNRALPAIQRWLNSAPRTLVHGDFRMDNLFFVDRPDEAPVACCDWQGSTRGRGIQDVAYLLSGSLPTELRRRDERALVDLWHRTLPAAARDGYDLDQAWQDYRRAVLYLWTYVVIVGGGMDGANDRARAWVSAMVARSAAAMLDLGCVELLAEFE